jgi:hypothetical protein
MGLHANSWCMRGPELRRHSGACNSRCGPHTRTLRMQHNQCSRAAAMLLREAASTSAHDGCVAIGAPSIRQQDGSITATPLVQCEEAFVSSRNTTVQAAEASSRCCCEPSTTCGVDAHASCSYVVCWPGTRASTLSMDTARTSGSTIVVATALLAHMLLWPEHACASETLSKSGMDLFRQFLVRTCH